MNTDLTFIYFTPADIQVPRVDRQGIVHFCESVYRLGVELELVTLGIKTLETEAQLDHPLAAYRIRTRFPVRTVATGIEQRDQDNHPIRGGLTRLWVNITRAIGYIRRQPRQRRLLFFCKNYGPALAFLVLRSLTRKKVLVFFEAHTTPKRFYQRLALRHADGVIANSIALGRDLVDQCGIPAARVLGIHQGIDLELVEEARVSREEARRSLGIAPDERLVVYAGKIYFGYREVEDILAAARLLPADVHITMLGGRADHVELYRRQIAGEGPANVRFAGFVVPIEVQQYLAAADALVMYYPSGIELNKYRSPGKLFEYMAAARPIIAADYPVLHEILGDPPGALLIPADDPPALAAAIERVFAEPDAMAAMARRAFDEVQHFTWEVRAKAILEYIDQRATAAGK